MNWSNRIRSLVFGVLMIPTQNINDWKIEQFSKIPKNKMSASAEGLKIQVESSASPIIFPIGQNKKILGFKIKGEFFGLPKFSDFNVQGEKGFDDYPLRLGFVLRGDKKLTGLKKLFAADWVKRLYDLVQDGSGLDHVEFFNVTQNFKQVGKNRVHPASDLFRETFFELVKNSGPFTYEYRFEKQLDVAAIWISIDGDDTKSTYQVLISELHLLVE